MADDSDDPTTATPVGHTQPMPATPEQAPGPGRPSGWRAGQVAVVAVLALLLGGAGATLAWLAADRGDSEPTDTAVGPTTSTSSGDADRSPSSTTTTSSLSTTTTSRRSEGGTSNQSGGQTVVGNGQFTGSYQGNSNRTTDNFTVAADWTIRWDVPEGAVSVDVLDAQGQLFESLDVRGQGDFFVAEAGTYRLDIRTDGNRYSVTVTDGP